MFDGDAVVAAYLQGLQIPSKPIQVNRCRLGTDTRAGVGVGASVAYSRHLYLHMRL